MSQGMGGQGVPGGANLDEMRRRMGGVKPSGGMQQDPGVGGPPVQPGSPNPAPPSAPTVSPAPFQPPAAMSIASEGPQLTPLNPYAPPPPQGGVGPKTGQNDAGGTATPMPQPKMAKPSVEPGAPIGPEPPKPSTLEMTGKPAGGQFGPTPQNPSPQGPSRAGGPMMKPAVGGAPLGGFTPSSWGAPGSGSPGISNAPQGGGPGWGRSPLPGGPGGAAPGGSLWGMSYGGPAQPPQDTGGFTQNLNPYSAEKRQVKRPAPDMTDGGMPQGGEAPGRELISNFPKRRFNNEEAGPGTAQPQPGGGMGGNVSV